MCPTCGRPATPIVYGMPDDQLIEESGLGLVSIGGCLIGEDSPAYYCSSCQQEFGSYYPRRETRVLDTQTIELLGRNRLVNELLRANLEVALPLRDRGVDLIAYVDLRTALDDLDSFVACPIQMKAATGASFGVWSKYGKFPNLILAFVWYIDDPERTVTYALTHQESVDVATRMGWTSSNSWNNGRGAYSTTNPSSKLQELLEPYRMTRLAWRGKILGISLEQV